ncbi:TonB C-terminal domain-containing protein [Vibrio vulnificus]|nr:TonB C-terminal domain-containing protein [Vibrio vulnificus]
MNFRKFLSASAIIHFALVFAALLVAVLGVSDKEHKVNLSNNKEIEAISEEALIKSVSVSEDELKHSLEQYSRRQSERRAELNKQEEEYNKAEKALKMKEQELAQKDKQLQKLSQKIQDLSDKAKILQEEEAKKKRNELEKNRQLEKKKKLEQEQKREAEIKERLAKQKEANERALNEILERNALAEKRELGLIRGKYENDIHELLYNAWVLPYDRKNVSCTVTLSISNRGFIENYEFNNACPHNYKSMIELAIERVKRLPSVPEKIFRSKEVVNFIDRVD